MISQNLLGRKCLVYHKNGLVSIGIVYSETRALNDQLDTLQVIIGHLGMYSYNPAQVQVLENVI